MFVEWWPVHDGVAGSAVPACVSAAAVTEAGDVTDEDLIGAEGSDPRRIPSALAKIVLADRPPHRGE